jgi:hypothetical protein
MTNSEPKPTPLHVETSADQASKNVKHICDNAPDKKKCEEYVERLGEATNNIDPKPE